MRRKINIIVKEIKELVQQQCSENIFIDWYGAFEINPTNLIVWICVKTDSVKNTLNSDRVLISNIEDIFSKNKYPIKISPFVHFDFESQETVDRESHGDWYLHFK